MQEFTVVITDDGEIGFFATSGDFQTGKANIAAMLEAIEAAGIDFASVSEAEQHRHGKEMSALHDTAHEGE